MSINRIDPNPTMSRAVEYNGTVTLCGLTADNKSGGAVCALDRKTGKIVWRVGRPKLPNYPSPIVVQAAGREQ